jgi:uncharacterized protein YceK
MKNVLMALILTVMLVGCCEIRTVYIPVSSCQEPPAFTVPTLMVDNLTPTATTQDKLQAVKVDHFIMRKSLNQCKALLDGYRKQPSQNIKQEEPNQ